MAVWVAASFKPCLPFKTRAREERAFLHECDELVDEGIAAWIEPSMAELFGLDFLLFDEQLQPPVQPVLDGGEQLQLDFDEAA